MKYLKQEDFYLCKNNRKLVAKNTRIKKSKTGYESTKTIYGCDNCNLNRV